MYGANANPSTSDAGASTRRSDRPCRQTSHTSASQPPRQRGFLLSAAPMTEGLASNEVRGERIIPSSSERDVPRSATAPVPQESSTTIPVGGLPPPTPAEPVEVRSRSGRQKIQYDPTRAN